MDKSYGEIRHEAKLAYMKDPVGFAQSRVTQQIDKVTHVKELIIEYFSDLQSDETPVGAMRRLQIRKDLLDFAHK
jgi:hypothetical protein